MRDCNKVKFPNERLQLLQSLIGKLSFVAHCVKPSCVFISRLLNWLRRIQNSKTPQIIPGDIKKDLERWYFFLPQFNGISMMDMEEWSELDKIVPSDACLSGCGAFPGVISFIQNFLSLFYDKICILML